MSTLETSKGYGCSCAKVSRVAEMGLTCALVSTRGVKKVPANILSTSGQVAAYYAIGAEDWKPGKQSSRHLVAGASRAQSRYIYHPFAVESEAHRLLQLPFGGFTPFRVSRHPWIFPELPFSRSNWP